MDVDVGVDVDSVIRMALSGFRDVDVDRGENVDRVRMGIWISGCDVYVELGMYVMVWKWMWMWGCTCEYVGVGAMIWMWLCWCRCDGVDVVVRMRM